jgi:hypothetical protein
MACDTGCVKSKLSACALGFAFGILKGLCLLAFAWAGWLWGYSSPMMEHAASFYYGYGPSFVGGLIGAAWGFVCGFVFGFVFGYIYNFCLCCCSRKSAEGK